MTLSYQVKTQPVTGLYLGGNDLNAEGAYWAFVQSIELGLELCARVRRECWTCIRLIAVESRRRDGCDRLN